MVVLILVEVSDVISRSTPPAIFAITTAFGKIFPIEAALLDTALLIGGSMLVSDLKTRRR